MTVTKTAVFRADASPEIGGGHIVRCLALADALAERGWRCGFAVGARSLETVPALGRAGHAVQILDMEEAGEPLALADHWPEAADWLIVDHYGRDAALESACRPWARNILVIDDLADRDHDCDILLDQTLGRRAADYVDRVAKDCRLLLGPDYALLRPAFSAQRAAALARREKGGGIRRILVSMGASDPHSVTPVVLEGIARSGSEAEIDVVLGAAAPALAEVQGLTRRMPQTARLHIDAQNMAELMAEADLAIGAGGTTCWERCCLGLPSLLLVLAENQEAITAALVRAGAARRVGNGTTAPDAESVAAATRAFADDEIGQRQSALMARQLVDGRGVERVVEILGP